MPASWPMVDIVNLVNGIRRIEQILVNASLGSDRGAHLTSKPVDILLRLKTHDENRPNGFVFRFRRLSIDG